MGFAREPLDHPREKNREPHEHPREIFREPHEHPREIFREPHEHPREIFREPHEHPREKIFAKRFNVFAVANYFYFYIARGFNPFAMREL